jgi:septal ring factor EnvC (AmiA/AmiB activator)
MCFGPSAAEKQAAAAQRAAAEAAKQEEIRAKAEAKRADISQAVSGSNIQTGSSGGGFGRRSLFSSGSASGFLGRFR